MADLAIGDVVLVLDGDDRTKWPLGRVSEVHVTERDGKVRKVTIKIHNKEILRSTHHVLLLLAMKTQKKRKKKKTRHVPPF